MPKREGVTFTGGTTAAEILANALTFWGEDGEGWMSGSLFSSDNAKACMLGGTRAGAAGAVDGIVDGITLSSDKNNKTRCEANRFIKEELKARGYDQGIAHFNDYVSRTVTKTREERVKLIRDVTCSALQRALKAEEEAGKDTL